MPSKERIGFRLKQLGPQIALDYESGMRTKLIALKYDTTPTSIYHTLSYMGVKRDRSRVTVSKPLPRKQMLVRTPTYDFIRAYATSEGIPLIDAIALLVASGLETLTQKSTLKGIPTQSTQRKPPSKDSSTQMTLSLEDLASIEVIPATSMKEEGMVKVTYFFERDSRDGESE